MNEKKANASKLVTALAIVALVALIGLSGVLYAYTTQTDAIADKDNQIVRLQNQLATPKLVSVGLQYTDNRSNANAPFLQITGYVVNTGAEPAGCRRCLTLFLE